MIRSLYYWLIKKHDRVDATEWFCHRCDFLCWEDCKCCRKKEIKRRFKEELARLRD